MNMNGTLYRVRLACWVFRNWHVLTMLHFEMLREGRTRLSRGQQSRAAWLAQTWADRLTHAGMPGASENVRAL